MEKLIKRNLKRNLKIFRSQKPINLNCKNHQRDSNERYEQPEKKICKLEYRTMEIIKSEEQKKKD